MQEPPELAGQESDAERRPLDYFEQTLCAGGRHAAWQMTRVVRLEGNVDPVVMNKAIREVVGRIPMLQASIATARWGPRLIRGARREPPSLAVLPRHSDDDWQNLAVQELHGVLDESGHLWRARLLHATGHGRSELVLTFHHAICDGMSANRLVGWILQAYGALERGRPCEAIVPPGAAVGIRRAAGSALGSAVATLWRGAYLISDLWRSRRYFHLPRDCPDAVPVQQRRTRPRFAVLDAELSAELVRRCRLERTSVHGALCAAMLLAAQDDADPADRWLSCFSNIDRRRHDLQQLADRFGCLTYYVVTRHRPFAAAAFWEAAREVSQQTAARIRTHGRPPSGWLGPLARPFIERILHGPGMGRLQTVGVSYAGKCSVPAEPAAPTIRGMFSMTGQHGIGPDAMLLATGVAARLHLTFCFVEPLLGASRQEAFVARVVEYLAGECSCPQSRR